MANHLKIVNNHKTSVQSSIHVGMLNQDVQISLKRITDITNITSRPYG